MISFVAAEECPGAEVLDVLLTLGGLSLGKNEVSLYAQQLFHGGVPTDINDSVLGPSVMFVPGEDPEDEILYGFNLPLDEGRWDVEVTWALCAEELPEGKAFGTVRVLADGMELAKEGLVYGKEYAVKGWQVFTGLSFETEELAPVTIRYKYGGGEKVLMHSIVLRKAE